MGRDGTQPTRSVRASVPAERVLRPRKVACIGAVLCSGLQLGCGGTDATYATPAVEAEIYNQRSSVAEQTPIVFRSNRDSPGGGDLYVMAPDGSNVRRLTQGEEFSSPVWARDGKSIALRQIVGVDASLGLLAPEGGELVPLVSTDTRHWSSILAWSASGDAVVYAASDEGAPSDLWVISRSGGQPRRLLAAADGIRDQADVSRVDSRIVYRWKQNAVPGAEHGSGTIDLWIADGTEDADPENLTEGRVYSPNHARWSPDGTRVAFSAYALAPDGSIEGFMSHGQESAIPPDAEIFVINVLTRELTRLTDDEEEDFYPAWTPDGNSLLLASARDHSDMDIWRMPLAAPEEAVNLIDDADHPSEELMPDYFWGLAPAP